MFVHHFLQVALPFVEAERLVLSHLGDLPEVAVAAHARALEASAAERSPVVSELVVGEPHPATWQTIVPMMWRLEGPSRLFADMEADLVVVAVGPSRTRLAFFGSYRMPAETHDEDERQQCHRFVEVAARAFLQEVARWVTVLAPRLTA